MKLSKLLFALACGAFVGIANAANITIFYSPTCPHCHHARNFIENTLIYEYEDLEVSTVNVTNADNRPKFFDTLKKCGYDRGGVPVLVIGEKCFQGYSDSMQNELRDAVEVDLSDEQKQAAASNKAELEKDRTAFVSSHGYRTSAVSEQDTKKKITNKSVIWPDILLYGFVGLLFGALGIILFKKQK